MTIVQYNEAQATKKSLLSTFISIMENDEVTIDNVASWASSYKSLMTNKDAIPIFDDTVSWTQISFNILDFAELVQLQPSALVDTVMPSIDNGVAVMSKAMIDLDFQNNNVDPPTEAEYSSPQDVFQPLFNAVDACINSFSVLTASHLVSGQNPVQFVYNNYRIEVSNKVNDGKVIMKTPLTADEVAIGNVQRQVVEIAYNQQDQPGGYAAFSVMRSMSPSYDVARGYESNPVTVHLQSNLCGNSGQCDISFHLETDVDMTYIPPPTNNLNANFVCPVGEDETVSPEIEGCTLSVPPYECTGENTMVEVYCPYDTTAPVCVNSLSINNCVTTYYDSGETNCDCSTAFDSMILGAKGVRSLTFFSTTSSERVSPAASVSTYEPTMAPTMVPTQEYKMLECTMAFDLNNLPSEIAPGTDDAAAFLDSVVETCGLDTSLPEVSVELFTPGLDERRRLISQTLNVKVQFSTVSYPNANLVAFYTAMSAAIVSSVTSGSFQTLAISKCNVLSCSSITNQFSASSVSVSPPSINGNSPTKSPAKSPKKKDDSAKFDAIWAVFGSLLGIYFLMLVYAASRRYIKRLEGKESKYIDVSVSVNDKAASSPEPIVDVEDDALKQLNLLKNDFKSRKITSSKPEQNEVIDDKDLDIQLASM